MQIWTDNPCENPHHGQTVSKTGLLCFPFIFCSAQHQDQSPTLRRGGEGESSLSSALCSLRGVHPWRRAVPAKHGEAVLSSPDQRHICFSLHKLVKLHSIFLDSALSFSSFPTKLSKPQLNFLRIWPQTKVDCCALLYFSGFLLFPSFRLGNIINNIH